MQVSKVKLVSGAAAFIAGAVIAFSPLGSAIDNLAYDFNFLFSNPRSEAQDVVLVVIDEPSFQELGKPWPWPRSYHAQLIDSLFSAGAKAVALDLIFAEPSGDDLSLVKALERNGPVVLATDQERVATSAFDRVVSVQPITALQTDRVVLGSAALPVDADGFVRRFGLPGVRGEASLAEAAASAFSPESIVSATKEERLINYGDGPSSLPRYSYYQALKPQQYLPTGALQGKLVFVGLSGQSELLDQKAARDTYPTPLTRWGGGYSSGVAIHAQASRSLLKGTQIRTLSALPIVVLSLTFSALALWGMFRFNPLKAALPAVGLGVAVVVSSLWLMHEHQLYVSWPLVLLPALGISLISPLVHYVTAWQERNFIHKAFSSYLAEPVVKQLMEDPSLLQLGGSMREGSVLFIDLQGFTSMAEKMPPKSVIEMLNHYLGDLSEIAIDEGGLIDKFIGDAIMVVWGTPMPDEDHAVKACRTALNMQAYLQRVREQEAEAAELFARIGIHSGEFVAGNVGGRRKFDYTVIGDTVNLAARLESANNQFGTAILISESTQKYLPVDDFATRHIDTIQVKGRAEPVDVFELSERC